ncbi:brain-specific angiogenesis inhibitor 1-associated protein 2-like protein 2 isoform X1 [Danio aesculapii]|uniref:brain-specific angiogenesis inhibitor 1-associated protein 2-like protein 2 isoform X1 n=1 Tax=Danio aesculapii TaxID=1142201 RepID=UPI0024BF4E31|nr:brain-specific angiogenesis inhibitor 1-associated protein 2-like protein 2 isoform X1 [Danio aesculapii]XP_056309394.1 brain-specific angiogenesis inhibitor 1-associated protein 2-like protein 2 isoform X1 [Danio aesculapii]
MSGQNSDQLHRTTLGIYTSIIEQFNPSLQRLVALGNSYIQAFQALAATSESYFNALSQMGEQAMLSRSSHLLGDVLIQMSDSQRRLTNELEGVFRWFHSEVLQEMDNNVRLDKDYISTSRRRYEMEVRNQATALERQMRRGVPQDGSEYVHFLKECQKEALKEEERRYRFLAEKHCGLTQSIAHLMNKTGCSLQNRAEGWKDLVDHTRESHPRTPSRLEDNIPDVNRWAEQPLGTVPSRGPSPQPSRSNSTSGQAGGRVMRALVPHPPSANSTLLPFAKGESITLLVKEPRNGWLFGRADSSGRQGWFPAAYVGLTDGPPGPPVPSSNSFRRSNSMNNLLDQPFSSSQQAAPPAPAPPPPPPPSTRSSSSRPVTPTPSENRRQDSYESRPTLFPRGTNPFATVKLKPTKTNDRSAPRI